MNFPARHILNFFSPILMRGMFNTVYSVSREKIQTALEHETSKNGSKDEREKQIKYRDARISGEYDNIWQTVGKCVFCDMREKYIVYEENGVVLTVPLYAYIDGHLNIIPRRHIRSAKELASEEWETVRKLLYIAKKMIREIHGLKGIQFIQKEGVDAQSTVEHLHFHVVPFDAPDLSVWNYRKLKYTPLENAELYKEQSVKMSKLAKRYGKKYEE